MNASRLERQIDVWMRGYPKWWRDANGEVLRGALLDQADETGSSHLSFADRRSLVVAGMTVREERRSRSVSVIAGLGFLALAFAYAFGVTWSPGYDGAGAFLGFSNPSIVALAVGVLAIASSIAGFPRLALAFTAAAVLLQAALVATASFAGWQGPSEFMLVVFGGILALATLPIHRVRTLVLSVIALVALAIGAQFVALVLIPVLVDVLS